MEDLRVEWLCSRVYDSLDLPHKDAFDELLSRNSGTAEIMIIKYLDESSEDTKRPLIFYTLVLEQDELIEVECGSLDCLCVFLNHKHMWHAWEIAHKTRK